MHEHCRVHGNSLSTRPQDRVFKPLGVDPACVNAMGKNHAYSLLLDILHDSIQNRTVNALSFLP